MLAVKRYKLPVIKQISPRGVMCMIKTMNTAVLYIQKLRSKS